MGRGINSIIGIIVILALLAGSGVFYVVDETQQVVLTQFGMLIGEPITTAGLYFKIPFIQKVNYFDKRIVQWDGAANQIPTLEKRFIWVDVTARWRIVDVLKFMQSVRTEMGAQTRLDDIIDASTRDIIASNMLIETIRNSNRLIEVVDADTMQGMDQEFGKTVLESVKFGRESLSRKILERAMQTVPLYGIDLIDVRIKRINYVKEVQQKVYERMISERKRAAEKFRSEGNGKRAEVEGQMKKELEQIGSEAYKIAQEVKGKADAEAIKIYANAFNNDPEFYSFVRTLDAYKKTFDKDTTLMLSTDNEFYKYLESVGNLQ